MSDEKFNQLLRPQKAVGAANLLFTLGVVFLLIEAALFFPEKPVYFQKDIESTRQLRTFSEAGPLAGYVKAGLTPSTVVEQRIVSALYILGGTQESLRLKFKAAAQVVRSSPVGALWVLSTSGITEYNEAFGRNLSNDEWALKELSDLEIEKDRVKFIRTEDGYFGTLLEAKAVRRVVMSERIRSLILICADYHSQRVAVTFSSLLKGTGIGIQIHTVNERIGAFGRMTERLKLFFYERLLLPWQEIDQDARKSSHLMRRRVA